MESALPHEAPIKTRIVQILETRTVRSIGLAALVLSGLLDLGRPMAVFHAGRSQTACRACHLSQLAGRSASTGRPYTAGHTTR